MSDKELIGMIEAEILGDAPASGGGLDASFLTSAASELLTRGVTTYQTDEAKKKAAADDAKKASAAIAADVQATAACADVEVAKAQSPSSVPAKQAAAQQATNAQDLAAIGLSADAAAKRVAAANDAAKKAADAWSADPKNVRAGAMAKCSAQTAAKATMGASTVPGANALIAQQKSSGGGNFLLKRLGPLPVYGWALVTVGLTGVTFGLVHLLKRKK